MKKRKIGTMISEIAFSNFPVLLRQIGFDFCIIDYEHGSFDYSEIAKMVMVGKLSNIEVIIRLADNQRKDIIKFMDMGVDGLLLPMTNSVEDIKQVVEYSKYSPLGKRGISTLRAHTLYNPSNLSEYMKKANQNTKIFAQIETIKGLKNAEEILKTEGVYGLFLGPNDLSSEFNCLDNTNAKEILDSIVKLSSVAKITGKDSGIITTNKNYLAKAKESEMSLFCVGSELSMIKKVGMEIIQSNKNN